MEKKDLRNGMVIEDKTREKGLVLNGYINKKTGCVSLANYNEDLTHKFCEKLSIEKIYKVDTPCKIDNLLDIVLLIWERPREIDWSKVPKWTKVQYERNGDWVNCYHINYDEQSNYWPCECTVRDEFTFKTEKYIECVNEQNYRIHPSVTIPEEWYK